MGRNGGATGIESMDIVGSRRREPTMSIDSIPVAPPFLPIQSRAFCQRYCEPTTVRFGAWHEAAARLAPLRLNLSGSEFAALHLLQEVLLDVLRSADGQRRSLPARTVAGRLRSAAHPGVLLGANGGLQTHFRLDLIGGEQASLLPRAKRQTERLLVHSSVGRMLDSGWGGMEERQGSNQWT